MSEIIISIGKFFFFFRSRNKFTIVDLLAARIRDNTGSAMKDFDSKRATPFSYGSGHIRPNRAMDPGLVYDLTVKDYLNFLCALGYNATSMGVFYKEPYKCPSKPVKLEDLNYPSIAVPQLNGTTTVTRTVKNVGLPGTYRVRVVPPIDISVSVKPGVLKFSKVDEEKKYEVKFKSEKGSVGPGYAFGVIIWSDGKHYVRTPMAVNAVSCEDLGFKGF